MDTQTTTLYYTLTVLLVFTCLLLSLLINSGKNKFHGEKVPRVTLILTKTENH